MNMELTFPEDAREARARTNRNLSEFERWASIAAGGAFVALWTVAPEIQRLAVRRARRAGRRAAASRRAANSMTRWASTRPAP